MDLLHKLGELSYILGELIKEQEKIRDVKVSQLKTSKRSGTLEEMMIELSDNLKELIKEQDKIGKHYEKNRKKEKSLRNKEYYEKNREKRREYYLKNREKLLERQNRYNQENKDRRKEYNKEYYDKNRARWKLG